MIDRLSVPRKLVSRALSTTLFLLLGSCTDQRGTFSGDFVQCNYGNEVETLGMEGVAARIVSNGNIYVPNSRTFFGRSLPRIDATIISTQCSKYINNGLEISEHSACQAIWGVSGAFVQSHEYGHAFHNQALLANVNVDPGCIRMHSTPSRP